MNGKQCDTCNLDELFRGTGWLKLTSEVSRETFRCPRCVTTGLLEEQKAQILRIIQANVSSPIEAGTLTQYIKDLSIME